MLYFLTGTTASGKSRIGHEIALRRGLKILSLDSMSVYKNLNILSDKPTKSMQKEVQYFGIDIVDANINFSIFDYLAYLFEMQLDRLSQKEDILAVGGTGLYYNAIVNRFDLKSTDIEYREYLESLNLNILQSMFNVSANKENNIDIKNKRRLIRALESKNITNSKNKLNFKIPSNKIGIFWDNPDAKHNIRNRTEAMLNKGLVDEVINIRNPSRTIRQAIGFKSIQNKHNDHDLIDEINNKTYRLVKRQKTWFKKFENIIYIKTNQEHIIRLNMDKLINEK